VPLQEFQKKRAFYGMELVEETRRLALMNLLLHDIEGNLELGDSTLAAGKDLVDADVGADKPALRHPRRVAGSHRGTTSRFPTSEQSSSPSSSTCPGR